MSGKLLPFCGWLLPGSDSRRSRGTTQRLLHTWTADLPRSWQTSPSSGVASDLPGLLFASLWLSASSPACLWIEAWPTGPFPSPNLRLWVIRAVKNRREIFSFPLQRKCSPCCHSLPDLCFKNVSWETSWLLSGSFEVFWVRIALKVPAAGQVVSPHGWF